MTILIQKLTIFLPMLLLFLGEMALGAEKPKKVDSLLAQFVNAENVVKQEETEQGGVQLKTLNNSMWERTADNTVAHLDRQGKLTKNVRAKSLLVNAPSEGKPKKVDSLLAKFVNPENVVKQEETEQGGVQLKTLNNSMWERTADNTVAHLDRQGNLTKNVRAKSLLASGSGDGKPKKVDSLLATAPSEGKPKKVDSLLAQFVSPENVVKQEETEQGGVQLKTLNNSMWERTADNTVAHLDRQGNLTKNVKAKSLLSPSATTGGLPPKVPKGPRPSAATSIGDSSNRLSEYVESLPFVDKDGTRYRVLKVDKSDTGHYVVSDKAASAKTLMYFNEKDKI